MDVDGGRQLGRELAKHILSRVNIGCPEWSPAANSYGATSTGEAAGLLNDAPYLTWLFGQAKDELLLR